MPYFRSAPGRYGGYNPEEELVNTELPPDHEPRTEDDERQTDIRRWIASIDQSRRMFGHHRSDIDPESTKSIEEATDAELDDLAG